MKILITTQHIDSIIGGAEQSLLTLAELLSKKHSVKFFNYSNNNVITEQIYNWTTPKLLKRIHIPQKLKFLLDYHYSIKQLRKLINQLSPDIIISQKPPIPYCLNLNNSCPVIVRVEDLEYITFFIHSEDKTPKGRVNFFLEKLIGKKIISELKHADLVIANSMYVSNKLKEKGISAEFIYPFIKLENYITTRKEPKYITFISGCLYPHKGFLILTEIAKNMPYAKFLAIGQDPNNMIKTAPKNIEWWGWVDDMKKVYSQTMILIVPSIIEEAFGRVVVEAQVNGIPVVASKVGGLPESVGNGGILIDDYKNPNEWVKTLKKLLNSNKLLKELSIAALEHSRNFDIEISYNKFKNLVKKKLGIEL